MSQHDVCPQGLVWLPDGHVSDWVLNALVDAEVSILPDDAVSHVDTCEHCTDRLATMAAMVFALGEDLTLLAQREAEQKVPFPAALFGAALFLTVGFALFSWSEQGRAIVELPHDLLTVWRGLRLAGPLAAQRLGAELVILSSFSVFLAAGFGVILARRHSFSRSPESHS